MSWTLTDASTPENRIFRRPLGSTEAGFYWDSVFARTADSTENVTVEVHPDQIDDVLSRENVERAWLKLKKQFPLVSATLREGVNPEDDVVFEVQERNILNVREKDLTFGNVGSEKEVLGLVEKSLSDFDSLSSDYPLKLHILRRTDVNNCFHIVKVAAHSIVDGVANLTVLRHFLQYLCGVSDHEPDLVERLNRVPSLEALYPKISLPRRRWRMAIAAVIYGARTARLNGGHTLPQTTTRLTPLTPAKSRLLTARFTKEETSRIIAVCRSHKITFGNALPVISQLAYSRVLYRLRNEGKISDEEWERRQTQPMHFGGPLNLRPFLDQKWFKSGGTSDLFLSINFFFHTNPFMPRSNLPPSSWGPGPNPSPPFSSLLSLKDFLWRSRQTKKQMDGVYKHPLFLEFGIIKTSSRIARTRSTALIWREMREKGRKVIEAEVVGDPAYNNPTMVFSNGGSSFGDSDPLIPVDYPLPSNYPLLVPHSSPAKPTGIKLRATNITTNLRCRPSELYLGASSRLGILSLIGFFDGNVYEDKLVQSWLDEAKKATLWYLVDNCGEGEELNSKL